MIANADVKAFPLGQQRRRTACRPGVEFLANLLTVLGLAIVKLFIRT
jgi:hypothetical protein